MSADLTPLRKTLTELLPLLEAKSDWYASIYFERKSSKTFSANLKQTQLSDQISTGAVLRIYDGYTLFEQATDELEEKKLQALAKSFAERVLATQPSAGAIHRPYRAISWSERLSVPLELEITSQIPKSASAKTEVHFGIGFNQDPKKPVTSETLERLKSIVARVQTLAPQAGLTAQEVSYVLARQGFTEEESIFIDRETNMSQTLYRIMLMVITMSGADRTFTRLGGLGGLESIEVSDEDLLELLRNLKALKSAARLHPGKYKVLIGPALTGVLAHEAFGHSQEADTCARGRSKAWELHQNETIVGNQHATILNNPAIFENAASAGAKEPRTYAAWGSYFFDEEGWLAQEQVLLDQGKLKAPMTNLTSALRLGIPRTANGKRESWANGVYTRQTNTYFSAGDKTLDDLMDELEDGFVAMYPAGGMEDPKGMGIQVGISFLEEVKNGKRTGRVFRGPAGGDIQLTGYTPDILNSILAKSKIEFNSKSPDQYKHPFNDVGGCGKYHKEIVHAGCGGPFVLLDQVTLG